MPCLGVAVAPTRAFALYMVTVQGLCSADIVSLLVGGSILRLQGLRPLLLWGLALQVLCPAMWPPEVLCFPSAAL